MDLLQVQTHFGMSRCAKMSLALNEPHEVGCSPLKLRQYLRACTTIGQKFLILYVEQPMENHMELTPDSNLWQGPKSACRLEGNLT